MFIILLFFTLFFNSLFIYSAENDPQFLNAPEQQPIAHGPHRDPAFTHQNQHCSTIISSDEQDPQAPFNVLKTMLKEAQTIETRFEAIAEAEQIGKNYAQTIWSTIFKTNYTVKEWCTEHRNRTEQLLYTKFIKKVIPDLPLQHETSPHNVYTLQQDHPLYDKFVWCQTVASCYAAKINIKDPIEFVLAETEKDNLDYNAWHWKNNLIGTTERTLQRFSKEALAGIILSRLGHFNRNQKTTDGLYWAEVWIKRIKNTGHDDKPNVTKAATALLYNNELKADEICALVGLKECNFLLTRLKDIHLYAPPYQLSSNLTQPSYYDRIANIAMIRALLEKEQLQQTKEARKAKVRLARLRAIGQWFKLRKTRGIAPMPANTQKEESELKPASASENEATRG